MYIRRKNYPFILNRIHLPGSAFPFRRTHYYFPVHTKKNLCLYDRCFSLYYRCIRLCDTDHTYYCVAWTCYLIPGDTTQVLFDIPLGADIGSRLKLAREDSSHPCQGVHQAFKSGKWSTEKEEEEMMLSDTGGHSNRRNINITLFRFPPVSLKYYIGFYVLLLNFCWQQEITIKWNRRLRASWGWWDIKPQKCFRNFKILVLRRESLNGHLTRWR